MTTTFALVVRHRAITPDAQQAEDRLWAAVAHRPYLAAVCPDHGRTDCAECLDAIHADRAHRRSDTLADYRRRIQQQIAAELDEGGAVRGRDHRDAPMHAPDRTPRPAHPPRHRDLGQD